MDFEKKKQEIEKILNQKIGQLKRLEEAKNQLSAEILQLQGKLNLISELEHERRSQSGNNKTSSGNNKTSGE